MDQKWSPYGSFFWAGSKNLWAEPNHAHREVSSKISFACEENRFSRFLVYFYLGLQNIFML